MARKQLKPDHVRVHVLGATEFQIGSRRIGMNTEALFALGLYLTTRAGERISRDEIVDLFWTDGAEESRRHAMRQMMYRLRQKGLDLEEEGEFLRLDPSRVESDLRDCLQADWVERASAADVEAALALGPTFSARLSAQFLDWFDGVRSAVAAQHRKAAQKQITQARREGRWEDVERWSQAVLQTDPLNEEATLARAESAAMSGSKVAALEILDTYLAEIGQVAPELGKPAVVLRKRIAEKRADWSRKGPREVEMVGRAAQLSSVTAVFDAVSPRENNCIVLCGPPGIGKTRLAFEALGLAELGGWRVINVRAQKDHRDRPLCSTLSVLQALLDLPGALGTEPPQLALLKSVASHPSLSPDQSLDLFTQASLIESFTALTSSISAAVRTAILIDDGHNVDDASRELLSSFIRQTTRLRFAWIVTTRNTSQPWIPSENVITVQPLTNIDAERLAELTLRSSGRTPTRAGCQRLASATGGNPLFLRESAAHSGGFDESDFRVPATLKDTIRARLGSLDAQAIRLLRCVSLLGRSATLLRCAEMVEGGLPALTGYVERLELEGIVYLSSTHTLSLHECWQQEILAMLPAASCASLSLECAQSIRKSRAGLLSLEDLWSAGNLYAKAGVHEEALQCNLAAADHVSNLGAYDEALETLGHAEVHVRSEWERLGLDRRVAAIGMFRGSIAESLARLEHVPLVSPPPNLTNRELWDWASCVALKCDALQKLDRDFANEETALYRIVRMESLPLGARLHAGVVSARLAAHAGNFARLAELHEFALRAEASNGSTIHSGLIRLIASAESGSEESVVNASDELARLEISELGRSTRNQSMRFRAVGLRMAGRVNAAIATAKTAYNDAVAFGNFEIAGNCAEFLVHTYLGEDALDYAAEWNERAAKAIGGSEDHVRNAGVRLAKNRLWQARGQHQAVLNDMLPRIESQQKDQLLSRRSRELLTFTVSALHIDATDALARAITEKVATEIASASPRFALDYPAEMATRALELYHPDAAEQFTHAYRTARMKVFPRPLGRFYSRLNKLREFSVSEYSET